MKPYNTSSKYWHGWLDKGLDEYNRYIDHRNSQINPSIKVEAQKFGGRIKLLPKRNNYGNNFLINNK